MSDHTRRYLESAGADGHLWRGAPTLVLTTRGRRTGQARSTALIYGRDGEQLVIVASKRGARTHPWWYLNLLADPRVTVQLGADRFAALARPATAEQKERLWPEMVRIWPSYARYQRRTKRDIPVVLLTRLDASAADQHPQPVPSTRQEQLAS